MTPAEILRAARKLIEKPEAWTKDWYARDARGEQTQIKSDDAVCWCGMGAIIFVGGPGDADSRSIAQGLLNKVAGGSWVDWQDAPRRKHSTILKEMDRAIALAETAP